MLPGERDMKDALAAVGCATYRELPQQPRAVRDLFHAEWTRRMHERCDIDPTSPPQRPAATLNVHETDALVAAFKRGTPVRELTAQFQVAEHSVYRILRRRGMAPGANRITPEAEATILARAATGERPAAIASGVGLHLDTIYRTLAKHGQSKQDRLAQREAEMRQLHALGLDDRALAARLGLHLTYVKQRRRELGLAPQGVQRGRPRPRKAA